MYLKILASPMLDYMEAFEPKWVNPVLNIIGVNSFRLGGLHISWEKCNIQLKVNILVQRWNKWKIFVISYMFYQQKYSSWSLSRKFTPHILRVWKLLDKRSEKRPWSYKKTTLRTFYLFNLFLLLLPLCISIFSLRKTTIINLLTFLTLQWFNK